MSEHTATPWFFRSEKTKALLYADNGDWLGDIATDDDAAFIVRAANSHEALVEALRAVEWGAADGYGDPRCPSCGVRQFGEGHAPDCQLDKALRDAEPD